MLITFVNLPCPGWSLAIVTANDSTNTGPEGCGMNAPSSSLCKCTASEMLGNSGATRNATG